MDREGFRNRMKQYKKAREENPGLKYYDFMERLAEFKAKEWNDDPGMVLQHMLNDNSYNYQQMYEDNPNFDIQEGHFVDTYKTAYHPTFSEESMYSGKKSPYNPEGIVGGSWDESTKSFYLNDKRQSKRKAQDYLNHADPGYRAIPKYDEGVPSVEEWDPRITAEGYDDKGHYVQAMNPLPEVTVVGSKTRTRSERPIQFTYVNGYPEASTITTDYNVGAGALEIVSPEFEILTGAKLLSNSLLSNSLTNELKFNNPPLSRTRKVNRNSAAAKRHLGTYNQSTDEISGNTIGTLLTDDGTEQFVFNSLRKDNEVFKMPNSYGRRSVEDLYKKAQEYLKFNKVPNYSKVRLEGHVDNGRGVLYPIFSQKRLQTLNDDIYSISGNQRWNNEIMPSLDKAMSKYGYKNIDGKYIKGNKIVGDIHPGNIGYTSNGDIRLIDAHIDGFAEGGEVGQRQLILSRANKVATNYSDAKDFTLDPLNYAVRKIAKTLTGRGGISNCTLSATGWIDPNNQYMSAKNIFDNPGSGYTEIDKAYALPGDLLIAKNPKEGSYHTMLIERFNGDDPVLRYSRGGHNTEKNLVTGRSLEEYHRLDNEQGGNHTEDHYFRYNLPNEYWLPEIVVTPKK